MAFSLFRTCFLCSCSGDLLSKTHLLQCDTRGMKDNNIGRTELLSLGILRFSRRRFRSHNVERWCRANPTRCSGPGKKQRRHETHGSFFEFAANAKRSKRDQVHVHAVASSIPSGTSTRFTCSGARRTSTKSHNVKRKVRDMREPGPWPCAMEAAETHGGGD